MSTTWAETLHVWLKATFPALAEHSHKIAKGDRGVMTIEVSVDEMRAMLAGVPAHLKPVWQPADEFIRLLKEGPGSISGETIDQWDQMLQLMDPRRDVALFIASTKPSPTGTYFTRFIITHDGSVPIH